MPICIEKKITLAGPIHAYSCELVLLKRGFGILKYIIDREYTVHNTTLSPGEVTCALYWEERPYTLYIWHRNRSKSPIYYFNIADSISLKPDEFVWRDLIVDVLIDDQGAVHVLDEHELPANPGDDLHEYILTAKNLILNNYETIIDETRRLLSGRCL